MTSTFRRVLEGLLPRVADPARRKRLSRFVFEDLDGMGPAVADAAMDAPAADADPDDAMWAGFQAAITAVLDKYAADEMDAKGAVKEIAKYLKAHENLADGTEPAGDEPADDIPAEESAKKKAGQPAPLSEALAVFKKVGFRGFDADDVEAVASLPERLREGHVTKLMKAAAPPAERPTSAGRGTVRATEAAAPPTPAQEAEAAMARATAKFSVVSKN